MSCGSFSLVGVTGADATIVPLRCGSWICPYCGRRKVCATIARVRAGMDLGVCRFMTLTSPAGETAEESYERFPARWKRMHMRLERRFGRIEYIAVVEPQERGAAHVHVIFRGPFIPQPWLSRAAKASGFGRIADIRPAHKGLMSYIAKYLTKQLTTGPGRAGTGSSTGPIPKYFRRVRWSKGWCAWTRSRERDDAVTWWIADVGQVHAALNARNRGYRVTELVIAESASSRICLERIVRWLPSLNEYRPYALPIAWQAI
jgi:hypothetical protein